MNAPVPPASEGVEDPLKQSSQFAGGYRAGFHSQTENASEQPDLPKERLQSGQCSLKNHMHYCPMKATVAAN